MNRNIAKGLNSKGDMKIRKTVRSHPSLAFFSHSDLSVLMPRLNAIDESNK